MKKIIFLIALPVLILALVFISNPDSLADQSKAPANAKYPAIHNAADIKTTGTVTIAESPVSNENPSAGKAEASEDADGNSAELISYAFSLMGTPYIYAGITPDGFDCSGFVTHVFGKMGINVPHSSALQANEGNPVSRAEAKEGDLVIFTGTNADVRTPGHVGIVISSPGDTISFIHSSSVGGVKVSQVEGTGYDRRFLEIRRVL